MTGILRNPSFAILLDQNGRPIGRPVAFFRGQDIKVEMTERATVSDVLVWGGPHGDPRIFNLAVERFADEGDFISLELMP